MDPRTKTDSEVFDYVGNPGILPDHITEGLSPEEIEEVKEMVRGCRLSRERDPEGAVMLDDAIERACEEGYI